MKSTELHHRQMACVFTATPSDLGYKGPLTIRQVCDNGEFMESLEVRRSTDTWRVSELRAHNLIRLEFPGVSKPCRIVTLDLLLEGSPAYSARLTSPRTFEYAGDIMLLMPGDFNVMDVLESAR